MKKLSTILLGFAMFFLASCSGSETYRGAWKAMDKEGEKFELVFKQMAETSARPSDNFQKNN
jgi:hypothetical protein